MTVEIAWEYDTRVWRQQLEADAGAWRLVRRIKESRADDTSRREPTAIALARGHDGRPVRFVTPSYTAAGAVYELSAPEVLASRLWPHARIETGELVEIMAGLGTALASLHADEAGGRRLGGIDSPHLRRLSAHLAAGSATHAGLVVVQQKPETIARLRTWLKDLPREGVLCHGGFTLGSVFVDADLRRIEVPVGDELMASAPELDLGWILGELTEFEYLANLRGTEGAVYAEAARALLDAWTAAAGAGPDQALLHRVVALRYFLHLCDFAETTQSTDTGSLNASFLTWLVERADAVPVAAHREERAS